MRPIYDSRDPSCKSPFGAVKSGQGVRFAVHLPKVRLDGPPLLQLFRLDRWAEPVILEMTQAASDYISNTYSCTFTPEEPMLLEYGFEIKMDGGAVAITKSGDGTGVFRGTGALWQLTVYDASMQTPDFMREGVFYQIFPDRFYNSGKPKDHIPGDRVLRTDWGGIPHWRPDANGEVTNSDYFGGDLKGITEKLDYLHSLGVTILYLNPIFEAHANHRYNTADYMKVDPLLGDTGDFAELCERAREYGIAVVLDGVFNHTGSDSVYFNKERRYGDGGAYNDPGSPYHSWYKFTHFPHQYESWWGFKTLPDINESDPGYRDFICGENGVVRHWLRLGASGFRLDVADELPDDFLDDIAACIKAHDPGCAMIGEVWEDASNKISYNARRRYLLGGQFDSIMNYPFMNAVLHYIRGGGGDIFYDALMQIIENYPPPVLHALMNMLSTHDTSRAITALVGESMEGKNRAWQDTHHYLPLDAYHRGCRLFILASILQFGLPGIPCVYYGDEAGLSGYRDPFNRVCYPWGHENNDLIAQIAVLGRLRNEYKVFYGAAFVPLVFGDDLCVFVRDAGSVRILFAVNRSQRALAFDPPGPFAGLQPYFTAGDYDGRILGPMSGVVVVSDRR
ncbi:MAG: glycoside hydrolase family 13 protein [Oscillospiraceae bacterium]|jgi:glycosidase|nr:glycoside hydrolase family 13 protein [Oscillospiraceae bacterium]